MKMFLRRKEKNRRLGRERILEVKLSSQQVRSTRYRAVGIVLSLLCGGLFVFFGVWRGGDWLLRKALFENSAFAIEQVEVQTDGVLLPESIQRWSSARVGDNLLALDLVRVKRDLELVPWIRSAAVERQLPHTLRLRVAEREAVAQTQVPLARRNGTGAEFLVLHLDENAFLMPPMEARFRATTAAISNEFLPKITGISALQLRPGRQLDLPQLRGALQLIAEFDRSPMSSAVDLEQIDLGTPEVLEVTTSQHGRVTFSLNDLGRQLRRWQQVSEYFQKEGNAIASLDLSISNNVPLQTVAATSLPAPAPRLNKPTRNRKKHV
jgi:hypothetical protein